MIPSPKQPIQVILVTIGWQHFLKIVIQSLARKMNAHFLCSRVQACDHVVNRYGIFRVFCYGNNNFGYLLMFWQADSDQTFGNLLSEKSQQRGKCLLFIGFPVPNGHRMMSRIEHCQVLDLMVRMLGFSEEDKQRIGIAQQVAGKGIVRGVLGLPGRLVGGMLGGGSPYVSAAYVPSENQSFADLWVDFLLKETEEREKKETAEAGAASRRASEGIPSFADTASITGKRKISSSFSSNYQSVNSSASQIPPPHSMGGNRLSEQFDREFLTIPLASAAASTFVESSSSSRASKLFPR